MVWSLAKRVKWGENSKITACTNAIGNFIPPFLIFNVKILHSDLSEGFHNETKFLMSEYLRRSVEAHSDYITNLVCLVVAFLLLTAIQLIRIWLFWSFINKKSISHLFMKSHHTPASVFWPFVFQATDDMLCWTKK